MNLGLTGKKAEDMVASFLRKKGYTVIKRNYYCRFGEVDIIVQKGDVLAFVEVKARKENSLVTPQEAVDTKKIQRMIMTSQDYIIKAQAEAELQPRFDVAEVTVRQNGKIDLNYIKNAF